MEYVVWAKGPALGPVRSFSADRRRREKRNMIEREESIQQNLLLLPLKPPQTTTGWILRGMRKREINAKLTHFHFFFLSLFLFEKEKLMPNILPRYIYIYISRIQVTCWLR